MTSPSTFLTLHLLLTFALFSLHVHAKVTVIPEDGYTITTILDGHKLQINPYSVLQRLTSSDLILLDSANSTFYAVQLPISKESVFRRFSGNGSPGYKDGDLGSAQFDKPKSFAIDLRGNVYVADRFNSTIRKISAYGVTTIAGGSSEKSFRKDGPAQNASFSNDFELAFIPDLCALLVSDHMHQLVHQINLKEDDCTPGSKYGDFSFSLFYLWAWCSNDLESRIRTFMFTWLSNWVCHPPLYHSSYRKVPALAI